MAVRKVKVADVKTKTKTKPKPKTKTKTKTKGKEKTFDPVKEVELDQQQEDKDASGNYSSSEKGENPDDKEQVFDGETNYSFESKGDYAYIPEGLKKFCISIDDVIPDKNNPRINDMTVGKLARSIKIHGFRKPIVIDQNNLIRAGNTAYKAAVRLRMKYMPVAQSYFDNDTQAVTYTISDNKLSERSKWDEEILKSLVKAHNLDEKEGQQAACLSNKDLNKLFVLRNETMDHGFEVTAKCPDEETAHNLFADLGKRGFKCRIRAL